jgi:uncharacterized protein YxeA
VVLLVDNEDDANSYVAKRKAYQNQTNQAYDDDERSGYKYQRDKYQRVHHGKEILSFVKRDEIVEFLASSYFMTNSQEGRNI